MTRQSIPLFADDISTFSRSLAQQLDTAPSHLSLMNMVARAAGFRNYQHLRAAHAAGERMITPNVPVVADHRAVEKTLNRFDANARLTEWPSRRKQQHLSLWWFWSRLPARRALHEREVNAILQGEHLFGDPAILRRDMVGLGMVTRNRDGSNYQRCELIPPPEARALIRLLEMRRKTRVAAA